MGEPLRIQPDPVRQVEELIQLLNGEIQRSYQVSFFQCSSLLIILDSFRGKEPANRFIPDCIRASVQGK